LAAIGSDDDGTTIMRTQILYFLAISTWALSPTAALADTLEVGVDTDTIQQALDLAEPGDTVVVGADSCGETFLFPPVHDLTLEIDTRGECVLFGDTPDAARRLGAATGLARYEADGVWMGLGRPEGNGFCDPGGGEFIVVVGFEDPDGGEWFEDPDGGEFVVGEDFVDPEGGDYLVEHAWLAAGEVTVTSFLQDPEGGDFLVEADRLAVADLAVRTGWRDPGGGDFNH